MKFSESTKNIFKALADFRKAMEQPKKEANNPQFRSKYVPLELVTDAIDKVAPNHGLAHFQNITTQDEYMVGVQTVITHESGEHIIFDWLFLDARPIIKGGGKGIATTQSQGSAITYGRRYSLSSAFGIASEVDDDGNAASGNEQQRSNNQPPKQPQQPQQPSFNDFVKARYTDIKQLVPDWDDAKINELLKDKAGVTDLRQVAQSKMIGLLKETINEIKTHQKSQAQQAVGGN